MRRIMNYVFLLSVVIAGCQTQEKEKSTYDSVVLKNYDLVNDAGITNFKYALYPPSSILRVDEYSKLSEVKNESIEALISSRLSESSMEWYRYNRDYQKSKDSVRTYEKYYKYRKTHKKTYELLSKCTYEYDGQLYARVKANMNETTYERPKKYSFTMINIQDRWYFTKNRNPRLMLRFAIGSDFIDPPTVYNILNKQPTNDGERLLLEQSLNGDGVLDFDKLSEALYSIREQSKENPAIHSILSKRDEFTFKPPPKEKVEETEATTPKIKEEENIAELPDKKSNSPYNVNKPNVEITTTEPTNADTFKDSRDGQTYKWVRLKDGKKWMAQNLNYKMTDSWCYDNKDSNCREYGRLYNSTTAKKACPSGWRLPSDDEWWKMTSFYGKADISSKNNTEGDAGKAAYKALIKGGSASFSALLGGHRHSDGDFSSLGDSGDYWSSTVTVTSAAWYYNFSRGGQALYRLISGKSVGRSCRCVQD